MSRTGMAGTISSLSNVEGFLPQAYEDHMSEKHFNKHYWVWKELSQGYGFRCIRYRIDI